MNVSPSPFLASEYGGPVGAIGDETEYSKDGGTFAATVMTLIAFSAKTTSIYVNWVWKTTAESTGRTSTTLIKIDGAVVEAKADKGAPTVPGTYEREEDTYTGLTIGKWYTLLAYLVNATDNDTLWMKEVRIEAA